MEKGKVTITKFKKGTIYFNLNGLNYVVLIKQLPLLPQKYSVVFGIETKPLEFDTACQNLGDVSTSLKVLNTVSAIVAEFLDQNKVKSLSFIAGTSGKGESKRVNVYRLLIQRMNKQRNFKVIEKVSLSGSSFCLVF